MKFIETTFIPRRLQVSMRGQGTKIDSSISDCQFENRESPKKRISFFGRDTQLGKSLWKIYPLLVEGVA